MDIKYDEANVWPIKFEMIASLMLALNNKCASVAHILVSCFDVAGHVMDMQCMALTKYNLRLLEARISFEQTET